MRTGPPTTFPSVAHPGNATNFPPSQATTASLVQRFPSVAQLFPKLGAREVKGRKGQQGCLPSDAARGRWGKREGCWQREGMVAEATVGDTAAAAGVRAWVGGADRGSVCGVHKEAVLTPQSFS